MSDDITPPPPLIILFDGTCGMCNSAVNFILARDPGKRFRFAPLQSPVGQDLMTKHHLEPSELESMVLIDGEAAYTKSTAVLRIVMELPEPWPLVGALVFVPAGLRDEAYNFIARHRRQWFKSADACRVPTPEEREQFLG